MQRFSLSISSRCRLSLLKTVPTDYLRPTIPTQHVVRRFRSGRSSSKKVSRYEHLPSGQLGPQNKKFPPLREFSSPETPEAIEVHFRQNARRWMTKRASVNRLMEFGLPGEDLSPLLEAFLDAVNSGEFSTSEAFEKYSLTRFKFAEYPREAESTCSSIFFQWASDPNNRSTLLKLVPESTVLTIDRLVNATVNPFPAELFRQARLMHRKFIMHVGPTNSGKTHNALRALAAAKSGFYAGPLRLLAHEIWERLNLGEIQPLGMDDHVEEIVATESALDDLTPSSTSKRTRRGNPKYARLCNMSTGEEHKIVDEAAPLLSCTVEMLSTNVKVDVAVVDEIQMIGDPQRGYGWTRAVLGLCADEIHLCGEETAVPIVQELLKETGDELTIKRYQRLTPLTVEDESINDDVSLVRKGDCIVTFTRSSIFALKKRVETETGMKCAVVYGKLPPETRSEQAALFNDPNSDYDVLIGSDAIGMGLNLKIRRIIFEAVTKYDGGGQKELSVSQIKQIAGRAGRFGLLGSDNPGGFVTSLTEPDLAVIRDKLAQPIPRLTCARLSPTHETLTAAARVLPPGSPIHVLLDAHQYIGRLSAPYRYADVSQASSLSEFFKNQGGELDLTVVDRSLLLFAPIAWRDEPFVEILAKFLDMYRRDLRVNLMAAVHGTDMMDTTLDVEKRMARGGTPSCQARELQVLEMFHKTLVFYVWMSYRNAVSYADHEIVHNLKARVEKALDWALEGVTLQRSHAGKLANWQETQAFRQEGKISFMSRKDIQAKQRDRRDRVYSTA